MTLSPGAKVQPNRSTLRSPAGNRAPTPPRFIGQRIWMSRMGLRPKRLGMRPHQFDDTANGIFGIVRLHEVKVAYDERRARTTSLRHNSGTSRLAGGPKGSHLTLNIRALQ